MCIIKVVVCKHNNDYICNMIERIRSILLSKNLNAAQFADQIGVQRSSISHVLSGRNKPSLEFIQKILKTYPDINSDWLISGNGEIIQKLDSSTSLFDNSEKDEVIGGNIGKMRPESVKKGLKPKNVDIKDLPTNDKSIERVIIFYKNGKFIDYSPYQH